MPSRPARRASIVKNTPLAWLSSPGALLIIAGVSLLSFTIWLSLTFGPILIVETKYQLKRVFGPIFPTGGTLQSFFLPNFEIDLRGYDARNTANGIVIPKIFLDEPVVYNVDPNNAIAYTNALKQGIAHASSTRFPDSGGLGYYFAHSSSPEFRSQFNAVFYLLGKLEPGDEIFVWHEGERFEYQVSHTVEVNPEDTHFLYQEYEKETIVLQTCWPPGTTLQRKLVFAERK